MNLLSSIQNTFKYNSSNTPTVNTSLIYDSGITDQFAVESVAIDNSGNVYATSPNANELIKITPDLTVSAITVNFGASSPNNIHRRIYIDSSNRFVVNNFVGVYLITNIQNPTTSVYLRSLGNSTPLLIYPSFDLLWYGASSIIKQTINPSTYSLSSQSTLISGLNNPNTLFQMALQPSTNNLYLTDKNNNLVKRYIVATQTTQTVPITVSQPLGICFDTNGYLYISEQTSGKIWKVDLSTDTQTLITTITSPKHMIVNQNNILFITSQSRYIYTIDLSEII